MSLFFLTHNKDTPSGDRSTVSLLDFLTKVDMSDKVITAVILSSLADNVTYRTFKITPRWQVRLRDKQYLKFVLKSTRSCILKYCPSRVFTTLVRVGYGNIPPFISLKFGTRIVSVDSVFPLWRKMFKLEPAFILNHRTMFIGDIFTNLLLTFHDSDRT